MQKSSQQHKQNDMVGKSLVCLKYVYQHGTLGEEESFVKWRCTKKKQAIDNSGPCCSLHMQLEANGDGFPLENG